MALGVGVTAVQFIVRSLATGGFLAAAGGFLVYVVLPGHTTPINRYGYWVAIVGAATLVVAVVIGLVVESMARIAGRHGRTRPHD